MPRSASPWLDKPNTGMGRVCVPQDPYVLVDLGQDTDLTTLRITSCEPGRCMETCILCRIRVAPGHRSC